MQILGQKYALKHKAVQRIHKKRTPCYKQVANIGVRFARSMSQIDMFTNEAN
jgi:hypothetical protein